jgi:hypothetical protein
MVSQGPPSGCCALTMIDSEVAASNSISGEAEVRRGAEQSIDGCVVSVLDC